MEYSKYYISEWYEGFLVIQCQIAGQQQYDSNYNNYLSSNIVKFKASFFKYKAPLVVYKK